MSNVTESAVRFLEMLADDDSHGYDQQFRWGERGDYDCSAAVITAWERAGVPVRAQGASYTGNMRGAFLRCGFEDVTERVSLPDGAGLRRGDVLLNVRHHTALFLGGGMEAEASINERGGVTGGAPGDQTGREILRRPYRNYPWDCVLRYAPEGETADAEPPAAPGTSPGGSAQAGTPPQSGPRPDSSPSGGACTEKGLSCTAAIPVVRRGDAGAAAAACQAALRHRGFDPVWIDGEAGERTERAIRAFQKSRGLTADGVCGAETWTALLILDTHKTL